jgi:hypothetical protein
VVDSLLEELNGQKIYTQGYADDLAVVVTGKFPGTIAELTQWALRCVEKWCVKKGLSINPDKTEITLFTRKRKGKELIKVQYKGRPLALTGKVKYLGVYLDEKLSWRDHVSDKIRKGIEALWACRTYVGRTWGLSPKMMHWIYTGVIHPRITYVAIV